MDELGCNGLEERENKVGEENKEEGLVLSNSPHTDVLRALVKVNLHRRSINAGNICLLYRRS